MSGVPTARVGWGDPDVFGQMLSLKITVRVGDLSALTDLTTVESADLYVEKQSGTPVVWGASIVGTPAPTEMQLIHPYEVTDLTRPETLKITPRLTTADGVYPCKSFRLQVVPG